MFTVLVFDVLNKLLSFKSTPYFDALVRQYRFSTKYIAKNISGELFFYEFNELRSQWVSVNVLLKEKSSATSQVLSNLFNAL